MGGHSAGTGERMSRAAFNWFATGVLVSILSLGSKNCSQDQRLTCLESPQVCQEPRR
jgi:hypothetical protein